MLLFVTELLPWRLKRSFWQALMDNAMFSSTVLSGLEKIDLMKEPKHFTDIVKAEAVSFGCQPTLRIEGPYHT